MPQQFLSKFFIKINGQDVPQVFIDALLEVTVDQSLYLPAMFTIELHDPDLKWVDDALLDLGKSVEISASLASDWGGGQGALISGEITALEPSFSGQGDTRILVRGYTKAHRLHRGKKTRTFLKQTDSAIAQTIAGEVGLSPQVDATSITYDYVIQYNQTNMEFLQARAARIGYQVMTADGKLYFKKGEANLGDGPTLKLGETLMAFRPQLASTHQADKVTVRGWDSKLKQAITGQATPNTALNQGGLNKTGGAAAQTAFGAAEFVVVNRPMFTQTEATELAKGFMNDLSGEFIQAEGVCVGHPQVKPGYRVTLSGVGTRFSGKYFVTEATHIYSAAGYETRFTISGRQPNTVNHLLETRYGGDVSRGLVQGVAIGVVTNLNDPDNLGRVKVKYPWLGDNIESDWLKIAAPGAGNTRGMYYLPEVNDEVLIAFEHGDVHRPYLIGGLWNNTDKPPKQNSQATSQGKVNQRIIQSRSGHIVILDDTQAKEQVQVKTKAGHLIILDDASGQEKITIRDKTNQNEMVIDSVTNNMSLKCGNKFSIDCTTLEVNAKANGTIKATSNLNLEGTVGLNAKGTNVAVNGNATVSISGNASTEVKSGAMVQIQGALVKIN